jgi:hypothetical protein
MRAKISSSTGKIAVCHLGDKGVIFIAPVQLAPEQEKKRLPGKPLEVEEMREFSGLHRA